MTNNETFGGGDNDVPYPDFIVPKDYVNNIELTREQRRNGIFKTANGIGKFIGGLNLVLTYPYRISEQEAKAEE